MPPIEINFFLCGKRLRPPPINLSEIELQRSIDVLSPYSHKDNGWMLCRFNPSVDTFTSNQEGSQKIAAWTPFNVNISQDDGVPESVVEYCQVIFSSPTEINAHCLYGSETIKTDGRSIRSEICYSCLRSTNLR